MRGGIWKGDILVADVEELDNLDASQVHARRLDAKDGDTFIFPVADGTVKLVGRDQALRGSISIQDHPARGEEYNDVFKKGRMGLNTQTNKPMTLKSETTSGVVSGHPFFVITSNLGSIFTCLLEGHSEHHSILFSYLAGWSSQAIISCVCLSVWRFPPPSHPSKSNVA